MFDLPYGHLQAMAGAVPVETGAADDSRQADVPGRSRIDGLFSTTNSGKVTTAGLLAGTATLPGALQHYRNNE